MRRGNFRICWLLINVKHYAQSLIMDLKILFYMFYHNIQTFQSLHFLPKSNIVFANLVEYALLYFKFKAHTSKIKKRDDVTLTARDVTATSSYLLR